MARSLSCAAFAAILSLAGPLVHAQPSSLATWVDACEVAATDLQALLKNEAIVVPAAALQSNIDGTYSIATGPYTEGQIGETEFVELCTDSRFFGQQQVLPLPVRSAIQVGADRVLTSWHGTGYPVGGLAVVFGLQALDVGGVCSPPDLRAGRRRVAAADRGRRARPVRGTPPELEPPPARLSTSLNRCNIL